MRILREYCAYCNLWLVDIHLIMREYNNSTATRQEWKTKKEKELAYVWNLHDDE